jgi:hypothetical protein
MESDISVIGKDSVKAGQADAAVELSGNKVAFSGADVRTL